MCFLFLFKAFQALTQQTLLASAVVTVISESEGGKVEINGKTPSWQTVAIIGGTGRRAQTAREARGRAASSCYNAGLKRAGEMHHGRETRLHFFTAPVLWQRRRRKKSCETAEPEWQRAFAGFLDTLMPKPTDSAAAQRRLYAVRSCSSDSYNEPAVRSQTRIFIFNGMEATDVGLCHLPGAGTKKKWKPIVGRLCEMKGLGVLSACVSWHRPPFPVDLLNVAKWGLQETAAHNQHQEILLSFQLTMFRFFSSFLLNWVDMDDRSIWLMECRNEK